MKVDDTSVNSLLLPAGSYDFNGTNVDVSTDTTIFSGKFTDAAVTALVAPLLISDTANYEYSELGFAPGDNVLVFDSSNWFQLQPVTVLGLDDSVVEDGDFHFSDLDVSIGTTDPNFKNLSVADHSIQIVDRRFDTENTRKALNQGFLALQDSIDSVTLPILGNFGDVAPPFIENFLGTLSDELRDTDNLTVESLTQAFNTAINTGIGIDTFSVEVTEITNTGIAFLLDFSDSLMTSVGLNSDFGLEALNLNIESTGTLDLFVDYGVSLGFGINSTDGFYIDTTTTGFNVSASLDLSDDFSATGELGFIQLDIADGVAPVPIIVTSAYTNGDPNIELKIDDPSINSFTLELDTVITFDTSGFSVTVGAETEIFNTTGTAVTVSASDGSTSLNDTSMVGDVDGTGIGASFVVTLVDANDTNGDSTQLTLSEITSSRNGSPFSFISYAFTGGAVLDLDISTSVSGNAAFPSFGFNLSSNLPLFNYGNEAEAGAGGGAFDLAFNDITLDMGGFVTDLLGPIISGVNDVLEPFQPIIEVLTSEVELLSKIGIQGVFDQNDDGKATLIEVALTLAGGLKNGNTQAKFTKFIDAVTGVIELTESLSDLEDSIATGNSLAINFGSYVLTGFKGASENEDATGVDPASGNTSGLDMNADSQTGTSENNKVGKFFSKLNDLGITLDVIENPLNVIKIFLGQDIDLVTWDMPELDLSFSIEQQFPVFAGIKGLIRGDINVYSDLVFGFDTVGLSQWKEKDFAIEDAYLIFDGFYLSDIDPDTGEDVDELTLEATIAAGVEASAVIASIEVVGGITGTAGLDLIDIGEYTGESDGRIRGSEIVSRISTPLELFEISGQVDAFLRLTVKIGIDLGFWSIEKTVYEKELARVTLFEFSIGGGGDSGSPAIASNVVDTLGGKGSIQATEDFSSSITNSNSFELDFSAPELADETNLVSVPAIPSLKRIDDEVANFEIAQVSSDLSEENQVPAQLFLASTAWPLNFSNGSLQSDIASNRIEEVASERSTHERIFSELNRSYDEHHRFDRLWSDYNRISGAAVELLVQRKSESDEDENSQRQTLDMFFSGLEQEDYYLG